MLMSTILSATPDGHTSLLLAPQGRSRWRRTWSKSITTLRPDWSWTMDLQSRNKSTSQSWRPAKCLPVSASKNLNPTSTFGTRRSVVICSTNRDRGLSLIINHYCFLFDGCRLAHCITRNMFYLRLKQAPSSTQTQRTTSSTSQVPMRKTLFLAIRRLNHLVPSVWTFPNQVTKHGLRMLTSRTSCSWSHMPPLTPWDYGRRKVRINKWIFEGGGMNSA